LSEDYFNVVYGRIFRKLYRASDRPARLEIIKKFRERKKIEFDAQELLTLAERQIIYDKYLKWEKKSLRCPSWFKAQMENIFKISEYSSLQEALRSQEDLSHHQLRLIQKALKILKDRAPSQAQLLDERLKKVSTLAEQKERLLEELHEWDPKYDSDIREWAVESYL
jgi:hypothetical protein